MSLNSSPLQSPEQLQAIRERAEAVANGFAQPKSQNARDVLKLLGHIRAQAARLDKLEREAAARAFSEIGSGGAKASRMGSEWDGLEELFGRNSFGAKR